MFADRVENQRQGCHATREHWLSLPGGEVLADIRVPESSFTPYRDEPAFVADMVRERVSLFVRGVRYRPLCVEFPGGSGIDVIHLGDDGTLLLSELKLQVPARPLSQADQAMHRIVHYAGSTLKQLRDYAAGRTDMSVPCATQFVDSWMGAHGHGPETTFGGLFAASRLLVAMGFNRPLGAGTLALVRFPLIAWALQVVPDANAALLEVQADGVTGEVDEARMAEIRAAHARYESRKPTRKRTPKSTLAELIQYYRGLPESESAARAVFLHFSGKGCRMDPGVDRTLGLQVMDKNSKPRTLVLLRGPNELDIPGNLEGHAHLLGVPRDKVHSLYKDLLNAVPGGCCDETSGANHHFHFGRIPDPQSRMAAVDRIIEILDAFADECGET